MTTSNHNDESPVVGRASFAPYNDKWPKPIRWLDQAVQRLHHEEPDVIERAKRVNDEFVESFWAANPAA
ncbi:hypothetical protein AGMMS49992_11170 [Clostridia bacterium]|nr:hypothetical protein AGMMS49992_11170 [Clostridia bacterium]